MRNSQKEPVASPDIDAIDTIQNHVQLVMQVLIRDWMGTAGQETPEQPTLATIGVRTLRHRLIKEELDELAEAYKNHDLVEVADALTDLLYVVLGSFVAHGINANAFFTAVHNNNTAKLAAGYRDEGGKWIKPENHLPPDLEALLVHQWRMSPIRADGYAVTCSMCKVANRVHKHDAEPFEYLHVLCDGVRVKL